MSNADQSQQQQPGLTFSFPVASKRQDSVEERTTTDGFALHDWSGDGDAGSSVSSFPLSSGRKAENASSAPFPDDNPQRFVFPVSPRSDAEKSNTNSNAKPFDFLGLDLNAVKLSEANPSQIVDNGQGAVLAFKQPVADVNPKSGKSKTQDNDFDQSFALPLSIPKKNPSNSAGWSLPVIEFPPLASFDSDGRYNSNQSVPSKDSGVESFMVSKIDQKSPADGDIAGTRRVASTSESNIPLPAFEPMTPPHSASPRHTANADQKSSDRGSNNAVDFVDELSAFEDIPIDESVAESLRYGGAQNSDQSNSGKPLWWKLLLVGIVVFVVEFVVLNLLF